MAAGAYEPHASMISLTVKMNSKKGTKNIESCDFNPYHIKIPKVEIKSSAGVMMFKHVVGRAVHNIGRVPL